MCRFMPALSASYLRLGTTASHCEWNFWDVTSRWLSKGGMVSRFGLLHISPRMLFPLPAPTPRDPVRLAVPASSPPSFIFAPFVRMPHLSQVGRCQTFRDGLPEEIRKKELSVCPTWSFSAPLLLSQIIGLALWGVAARSVWGFHSEASTVGSQHCTLRTFFLWQGFLFLRSCQVWGSPGARSYTVDLSGLSSHFSSLRAPPNYNSGQLGAL